MAILILGQSTCSICGQVLKETEEIISWQAFLDESHPLWKYSDSGMHASCFAHWEYKEVFEHLYQYQPCLDLDKPEIQELIQTHGTPDWIQKVLAYRKQHLLDSLD
ncbi:MAG: hypothetical protein AAFW00_15575 [Bacteroidota bacterium]